MKIFAVIFKNICVFLDLYTFINNNIGFSKDFFFDLWLNFQTILKTNRSNDILLTSLE